MRTTAVIYKFMRDAREVHSTLTSAHTDALNVILVWEALGYGRQHQVLDGKSENYLVARLHYPPDEGSGHAQMQVAIRQLHERCRAHGMEMEPATKQP